MLNMKKGLALVLAAATAFTFAPVASLDAFAGSLTIPTDTMTVDQTITYTWNKTVDQDVISGGTIEYTDNTVDGNDVLTGPTALASDSFTLTAKHGSTTPVTVTVKKANGDVASTFKVNVRDKSNVANLLVSGSSVGTLDADYRTFTIPQGTTGNVALTSAAGGLTAGTLTPIQGDSVTVTGGNNIAVSTTKTTDTTFQLTSTGSSSLGTNHTFIFTLRPVSINSTLVVEGKKTNGGAKADEIVVSGGTAAVKEVTRSENTYQITSSIDNQQTGESVKYDIYTENSLTTGAAANVAEVSKTGLVTVRAAGFDAGKPLYVKVSKVKNNAVINYAVVTILPVGSKRTFTTLSVTPADKEIKATASYGNDGQIIDGTASGSIFLSTKDKKTAALNANATDITVTSSNPEVVAVDNGSLVAKKEGLATVTVVKKSNGTTYGNATITLTVQVTSKYATNKITADDLTLTNNKASAKISAKADYNNALVYEFVKQDNNGNWVSTSYSSLTLNRSTGDISYKKDGNSGTAYVEITGTENDQAVAPTPKVITVKYQPNKDDSNLTVSTPALNLKAGETGDIKAAATGTSISYVSYAPEVATVDAATGKVTAVSKGTAVVAVNAAETDTMKAGQKLVYVTVDNGKIAAPAKVAGLKVTNAKGAKVNVSWTSQGKNIQYRVYKKVGNGKWVAKNVTKGKASLSVKKGAKVQVKVKAFVKDQDGKTVWGPKATKKTFKTDNK